MDIERIDGYKSKLSLNDNRERVYLFGHIPKQLGRLARLSFAVKRTFSEDLSEKPLTVTLDAAGMNGLQEAIQHRLAGLQTNTTRLGFQIQEVLVLEQASGTLAEFMATEIQEAA